MFFKRWRRRQIGNRKFPDHWLEILQKDVPPYRRLSAEDQSELQRHILIFLNEKRFEGCGGLLMTDQIRVVIAAQACMLLLHRKTDYYPGLTTILVYPRAFIAHRINRLASGVVIEDGEVLLGESWEHGSIVLSWDDVKHGAADIGDGHNVVFHEFAHQIDSSRGRGDDSIVLCDSSSFIAWARTLQKDYEKLRQDTASNRQTLLNKYGATNPAEFFAVATEFFFEKPKELKQVHPELYAELKNFYQQDPVDYSY